MNRDLIVNICGTLQLLCVGTLGYIALKRNEECYEAQMELIEEKKRRMITEMDNIYLRARNTRLEGKLKNIADEEKKDETE